MVYATPIIYVSIFCLQIILLLIVLSFFFYYENKAVGCTRVANIWCWDDWTCKPKGNGSTIPDTNASDCYQLETGMPSCLFGLAGDTPSGIATNCIDNNNCTCDLTSTLWEDPCAGDSNCTASPICS